MQEVTPRSVGALIALYERAVGIYASLVNINAYHQPGNNYLISPNIFLDSRKEIKVVLTLSCFGFSDILFLGRFNF